MECFTNVLELAGLIFTISVVVFLTGVFLGLMIANK